ncbi:MAG: hypothetical protein FWD58_06630 [Firmicutes bacterium]|nr:hypothetical protein [Bacillota bacterium]
MPKYTYKFCDGTVSEVEVSVEQYALLKEMDTEERRNNRRHRRRTSSLASHLYKEEKDDKERDKSFWEDNG